MVLSASLLVACGPESATTENEVDQSDTLRGVDVSNASPAQRSAIRDRRISQTEYVNAFEEFGACLGDAGFSLVNVDRSARLYSFGIPDAAVSSGVDERCYEKEFKFVDILWQTAPGAAG